MRKILFFTFICFATISGFSQYKENTNSKSESSNIITNNRKPVLVELFTSQSCFSCPPAEAMLNKLETEQPFEKAELITLEFHVDYKDGFGRKDVYASPLFTQRQQVYDRKFRTGKIYTPQMVVDGDLEFIGSKFDRAEKAIEKTIKVEKGNINLTIKNERLDIKISNLPEHEDATIYLAIAQDGITTRDKKGENTANVSIVRRLNGLGRIAPNENSFELNTNFQIQDDWDREKIKLIVFIQENASRVIRGVGRIPLEFTNEDHKL